MLLRYSQWPSWLVATEAVLMVLLFSGRLSVVGSSQPLMKICDKRTNTLDEVILYYVERESPGVRACTRYAWSTVGYPTLFISQDNSSCECNYHIDTDEYIANQTLGSVSITGTDSYFSLAIVFTRLIEFLVSSKQAESYSKFNVTEVCSELDDPYNINPMELTSKDLNWTLSGDELKATLKSESNFSFTIKTHFPDKKDFERLDFFPKPQISENATLIDLVIQKFNFTLTSGDDSDDDDKGSRLALEMFLIHGPQVKNGNLTLDRYLDDEYTPSIFSSWTYNVSGKHLRDFYNMSGYVHWKPISYQDDTRRSTVSQQVTIETTGDAKECSVKCLPKGLATALFGDVVNSSSVNVTRWFAVFGTEGDDNYFSPEYSTWTLVVGYGKVPFDTFSITVIITIIVGLGIPGALIIVGGVYVFIKKKPWQNASRMIAKARGRGGYTSLT